MKLNQIFYSLMNIFTLPAYCITLREEAVYCPGREQREEREKMKVNEDGAVDSIISIHSWPELQGLGGQDQLNHKNKENSRGSVTN